jgi:hypothetical protein
MKPATVNRAAKQLTDNSKITTRLAELRAPVVKDCRVTLENHLTELKELRDTAKAADNLTAAISAEEKRGKVSGLYVDKIEAVVQFTHEQMLNELA